MILILKVVLLILQLNLLLLLTQHLFIMFWYDMLDYEVLSFKCLITYETLNSFSTHKIELLFECQLQSWYQVRIFKRIYSNLWVSYELKRYLVYSLFKCWFFSSSINRSAISRPAFKVKMVLIFVFLSWVVTVPMHFSKIEQLEVKITILWLLKYRVLRNLIFKVKRGDQLIYLLDVIRERGRYFNRPLNFGNRVCF